jgi:hypothetical protein
MLKQIRKKKGKKNTAGSVIIIFIPINHLKIVQVNESRELENLKAEVGTFKNYEVGFIKN